MQQTRRLWLPTLFCLGGLLLAHHETVLTGFALVQTDPDDTRFLNYLLEHGYRWLLRQPGHLAFWSPPFFYPARNVAAYSEVMLGVAPIYWAWRAIALDPYTAYQALMLSIGTLNFAAMYVLLRRCFAQGPLAASIGAALFAFSAPRVNQVGHLQLWPHFWSVGCLYALLRLFAPDGTPRSDNQRRRWIWLFVGCAAMQLLAGFYLGWFLALAVTIAGAVGALSRHGQRALRELAHRHYGTLIGATTAAGLLLLPTAAHFYGASREVGLRAFDDARETIPSLASWAYMGPFSWVYGWTRELDWLRTIPRENEQRLGLGVLTTTLALAGLWIGRKDPKVRFVTLVSACLFVLAISVAGFTLWQWVFEFFPAAQAIRNVSRVGLLLLIPVALGVSLFVTRLTEAGRFAQICAFVLGLMVLAEQGQTTPTFDKEQYRQGVANIVRNIDAERCAAFVFSPVRGNGWPSTYQIDAMWAQMESGVPTLNGYSGNQPPGWLLGDTRLFSADPQPTLAAAIDRWVRLQQLDPSGICWLRLRVQEGGYWATFVAQSVPQAMVAGQLYRVQVTLENTGEVVWRPRKGFRLGSQAPPDTGRWGPIRVELPSRVPPGATAVVSFDVVAPADAGVYPFQWKMIEEGVLWFGQPTDLLHVAVAAPSSISAAAAPP